MDVSQRLVSLDVFRGATIAAMILVNNPGSWDHVYSQLRHAEWHGWTFTDWIFPFFLFIMGVAMTFSFHRRIQQGHSRSRLLIHALKRSVILFLLGLFINGFPFGLISGHEFSLASWRIPGVLQRIAACYLAVSFIFLYSMIIHQKIKGWQSIAGKDSKLKSLLSPLTPALRPLLPAKAQRTRAVWCQ